MAHPMPKKRQTVLDEDSYLRAIDTLVERQFFPENELLALENAYLEAEAQNDLETMKNLTIRRKELQADKIARTPFSMRDIAAKKGGDPSLFDPEAPGQTTSSAFLKENKLSTFRKHIRDKISIYKENGDIKTEEEIEEEEEQKYQEELHNLESDDYNINNTITLNGFLSKHTSEDNQQYHKVQRDIDAKKHLAKFRWVYELDAKHRKHVPYATADAGLGITAKKKLEKQQERLAIDYKIDQKEKQLPLIPVGEAKESEIQDVDKRDEEGRAAPVIRDNKMVRTDSSLFQTPEDPNASRIINNWRYISKNNVMFYRDAIGSKYDDGKFKKPMQINYDATRFKQKDPYAKQLERMKIEKAANKAATFNAGHVGKDGSSVNKDGSWTPGDTNGISSFGDTPGTNGRTPAKITPGFGGPLIPGMTPGLGISKFRVGGITPSTNRGGSSTGKTPGGTTPGSEFSGFVPNTPSITPGAGPDESPMMTWGTLGTTPIALTPKKGGYGDHGDDTSRYQMPGNLKRDVVADRLLEKVKTRDRMKKNKVMDKAKKSLIGDTPDRLGSVLGGTTTNRLTPAARNLASRTITGLRTGTIRSRSKGSTPLVKLTGKRSVGTPTPGNNLVKAKLAKITGKSVTGNLL